jgi:DNA-binding NarL/FixJ family response regulator
MDSQTHQFNGGESTFLSNTLITSRELEILKLIAQGLSGKEIADILEVSHRTIDAHKQKMMHKLGTRKSAEMVAIAYKMKWI